MTGVQRFRTKPVEVDAIQWTGDNLVEVMAWCGFNAKHQPDGGLSILTNEGTLWVRHGNWVIRSRGDELRSCSPATFADAYESVE